MLHYKIKRQIAIFTISVVIALMISKYTETFSVHWLKSLYFSIINKKVDPILLDEKGIPYTYYSNIGYQRNPITISQKMTDYYDSYSEKGDQSAKQFLINNADWLVANAVNHGNYSILEYSFPWPTYDMTPKWQSGMAQGLAIKSLVKTFEITGDKKYLDTAEMLLNSFFVEVNDGGVTYKSTTGWWYEEYADIGGKQPKVLNGMMYTLLGINDYYQFTQSSKARFLFSQGLQALTQSLPQYDDNGYSFYDALGNPAWEYHRVHIELLDKLYNISRENTLKEYRDKWKAFEEPYSILLQIQHPTSIIFVAFISNFIILLMLSESGNFAYEIIRNRFPYHNSKK